MKSRLRFGIAIALAAVLGGWLFYASIGGSMETYASPSQIGAGTAETYRLNGLVAPPAPADAAERAQSADGLTFWVRDKTDASSRVKVVYRGNVPDAFRGGREVVVTGRMENGTFVAKRNSLVTLCPSKFTEKPAAAKSTAEQ
jgi:cytochrome c-type biogenesis protein CcmE